MKNILLVISVVISTISFAQLTIVDVAGNVIPNGSVVEKTGNPTDAELEQNLWVVNEGAAAVDVKCRRVEIDVLSGTTNTTCWVICPTTAFNAGQRDDAISSYQGVYMTETVQQYDTAKTFAIHYTPENLDGCSWFRVMWFTGSNGDEYDAYVDIKFNHATLCSVGMAGDINGNGIIDGSEIAGDADNSGSIDGSEIAGDLDGNGVIDAGEIAGDINSDGLIASPELTGDVNGNGTIDAGEELGDENGDGMINFQEVGIEEIVHVSWSIYPNPSNNQSIINISTQLKGAYNINVFDLLGKKIDVIAVKSNKVAIDTEEYNDGVYFISLSNGKGIIKTSKLVVKH